MMNPTDQKSFQRAIDLIEAGHPEATASILQSLVVIYPGEPAIKTNLARCYIEIGKNFFDKLDFTNSVLQYSLAIGLEPQNPEFFALRALSFLCMRQWSNSIQDCEKAIEIDPEYADLDNKFRGAMPIELPHIYMWSLAGDGQYDKLNSHFEKYLTLVPQDFETNWSSLQDLLVPHPTLCNIIIYEYSLRGEFHKALPFCDKAIEINGNSGINYFNRGEMYRAIDDYQKAIDDYTKAIELKANLENAYYGRGESRSELRDWELAIEDYKSGIQYGSDQFRGFSGLGYSYMRLGNYDLAEKFARQATNLKQEYPGGWHVLGLIYKAQGRVADAFPYFNRAVYLRPHQIRTYLPFYSKEMPAPSQIRSLLEKLGDQSGNYILSNLYEQNTKECFGWNTVNHLFSSENLSAPEFLSLKAIGTYYMGFPEGAFMLYEKVWDEDPTLGKLSYRDLYYFLLAADGFLEPADGILAIAMTRVDVAPPSTPIDSYYAALILCRKSDPGDTAHYEQVLSLIKSSDFLPALYLQIAIVRENKLPGLHEAIQNCLEREIGSGETMLAGANAIHVGRDTRFESLFAEFCRQIHHFELPGPIQEFRNSLEVIGEYEGRAFWEIFDIGEDALEEMRDREIEKFKTEFLSRYVEADEKAGDQEHLIVDSLENFDKKRSVLYQLENDYAERGQKFEQFVAQAIFHFELSKKDYLLMIRLFYIRQWLPAEEAILLSFYVLARHRDQHPLKLFSMKVVEEETRSILINILKSIKLAGDIMGIGFAISFAKLFARYLTEMPYVSDSEQYFDFKRRFWAFAYDLRHEIGEEKFYQYYNLESQGIQSRASERPGQASV